jgi:Histidine kinase-, DNA gyrase B-, and HSP90-like ATPase
MELLSNTGFVAWVPIQAGQDHLRQYTKKGTIEALAELIWNGLDAEAATVDVDIESQSMLAPSRELSYVTRIVITDTGHGIDADRAQEQFSSLGDSWKTSLNGRTLNSKRALHGSAGRGRFLAYSLGDRVRWSSISNFGGSLRRVEISGTSDRINGFQVDEIAELTEPSSTGTTVVINVPQGRPLSALLRDDLVEQLTARFAIHLLGNPDLAVRVNGIRLDPSSMIEGSPVNVPLSVDTDDYLGYEPPVMTIVDWADSVKVPTGVVLCTADGVSLLEIDKGTASSNVRATGYLRWSGWAVAGIDLITSQLEHASIIDAGRRALAKHIAARTDSLMATIVTTLKEERAYPYPDEITDPVQETERQLFDLVAVTARGPLRSSTPQNRKMTARLLQLALQERPESLDHILADVLSLSDVEREELADLLTYTPLSKIVSAAAEVTRRLDLLATLRNVIYTRRVAAAMREVDQLHPLVKDNVWLFGEPWRLSASEIGLTNVLREVARSDLALEADLIRQGQHILLPEGKRGRVDLLMQRTLIGPDNQQSRLVVELKRPSIKLGDRELDQVRKYARVLTEHAGAGKSHWSFWLVGSEVISELKAELSQVDREWGHIVATEKYDLRVTTWGTLLDQAERSLQFYKEQLTYSASQEESTARIRHRHEELLPPP